MRAARSVTSAQPRLWPHPLSVSLRVLLPNSCHSCGAGENSPLCPVGRKHFAETNAEKDTARHKNWTNQLVDTHSATELPALLLWQRYFAKYSPVRKRYAISRRRHHMLSCSGTSPPELAHLEAVETVGETVAGAAPWRSSSANKPELEMTVCCTSPFTGRWRVERRTWARLGCCQVHPRAPPTLSQRRKTDWDKGKWPLLRHGPTEHVKLLLLLLILLPGTKSNRTVRFVPRRKPKCTFRRPSRLSGVGSPGHSPSRERRTTQPLQEPQATHRTDTALPPSHTPVNLWPGIFRATPRTRTPKAPGHLPRADRSRCWQHEHTRLEFKNHAHNR